MKDCCYGHNFMLLKKFGYNYKKERIGMKIKKKWISPNISKISIVRETKGGVGLGIESNKGVSTAQPNKIRPLL
jgi:hypothetical protein